MAQARSPLRDEEVWLERLQHDQGLPSARV
jgi:hypothetical protein